MKNYLNYVFSALLLGGTGLCAMNNQPAVTPPPPSKMTAVLEKVYEWKALLHLLVVWLFRMGAKLSPRIYWSDAGSVSRGYCTWGKIYSESICS